MNTSALSASVLPTQLLLSPADSAAVVAQVYTVSLIATVPLLIAGAAAIALVRTPAGTRSLIWRSATLALLIVYFGHWVPFRWIADIVPAALAAPLVMLGQFQLAVVQAAEPIYRALSPESGSLAPHSVALVQVLAFVYVLGVAAVLLPLIAAWVATYRLASGSRQADGDLWFGLLHDVRSSLGVKGRVRLLLSSQAVVPQTFGVLRPVILLPKSAESWSPTHRRAVLLHEMAHVRRNDVLSLLASRLVCALFWFHPAAWYVARRLREECELACDDRVLESGVYASDYAELLMMASDGSLPRGRGWFAIALSGQGGLRRRLMEIVDVQRDVRAPAPRSVILAAMVTLAVALPASSVRLAPTRDVLTTLMRDARWETRAYAVIGLAQRADSLELARAAATSDPSPRVRAWARIALAQSPASAGERQRLAQTREQFSTLTPLNR